MYGEKKDAKYIGTTLNIDLSKLNKLPPDKISLIVIHIPKNKREDKEYFDKTEKFIKYLSNKTKKYWYKNEKIRLYTDYENKLSGLDLEVIKQKGDKLTEKNINIGDLVTAKGKINEKSDVIKTIHGFLNYKPLLTRVGALRNKY